MSLTYNETDGASLTVPAALCSPNGLGVNAATGRLCGTGAPGTKAVTATLAASEVGKIYALLDIAPTKDTRNWAATNLIFTFAVSSFNAFVDWVRTDVCHVNAAGASLESLGTDTVAVNLGPDDPAFRQKSVRLKAASNVAVGDRIAVVLSFTNATAAAQSFGWTPAGSVVFDSWLVDAGLEMVLGRKRPKRQPDDDALALLLADDDVP